MHNQKGQADLVRSRDGRRIDTFPLASVYSYDLQTPERDESEALLPAWPSKKGDEDIADDAKLSQIIQSRALVSALDLHDYDHDGRATEFVLPVGGVGCAMHASVVVGISKRRPQLHVFGSATHPDSPILLAQRGWLLLRTQPRGKYVEFECDFRGGTTQIEVELKADVAGIHVVRSEYSCPRRTGQLLSRVEE